MTLDRIRLVDTLRHLDALSGAEPWGEVDRKRQLDLRADAARLRRRLADDINARARDRRAQRRKAA